MAKLVILNLDGDLITGFRVSLEIKLEREPVYLRVSGELPAAPELLNCLAKWQQQYYQLEHHYRIKPKKIIYNSSINSQQELVHYAISLQQQLQNWLKSPGFLEIDRKLREELNRQEIIRLLICSDRLTIYQLPWYSWNLLESYPKLEIAFSKLNFERVEPQINSKKSSKVKILAILGNSQGIDLESDRAFLNSLANAQVFFLVEPSRQQLYDYLYRETWDIIFFAGHSKTIDSQGILYLNPEDAITITELKYAFKNAIAAGLQLAIFNSCDGLGLAWELAQLSLPQSIVMRLPIPDLIAQKFLRHFLEAYTAGNSLYLASRMAREQLQGWEKEYPHASWLPVIYQNPAITPPYWQDLYQTAPQTNVFNRFDLIKSSQVIILVTAIATGLVWCWQTWGWLQFWELKAYDRAMSWRISPPASERILIITIDDNDIKYQQQQRMIMQGSLSDDALLKLLTKVQPHQPSAIALDIIHDFPFAPDLANKIQQTDNFYGICRINSPESELISIESPPGLSLNQIGFSNLAIDPDDTIRRQILGMTPDRVCQSDFSLSLRLALAYLGDVSTKLTEGGIQIGDVVFPQLQTNSGGYRLPPKDARGYQILLNYQSQQASSISLKEILNIGDRELETLVKDKIVLIGSKGHNRDVHYTPYSSSHQTLPTPGVFIHAQAIEQIIAAVLDGRKPLAWVSDWIELFWIALWSLVGSVIMVIWRTPAARAIAIAVSLTVLFICYFGLFVNSIWLVAIAPALGLLLSSWVKLNIR
ncbi:MAG: CHASE2 domain-containing protein [Pleurocapsa sp.]